MYTTFQVVTCLFRAIIITVGKSGPLIYSWKSRKFYNRLFDSIDTNKKKPSIMM